jgi:hypothetical protein
MLRAPHRDSHRKNVRRSNGIWCKPLRVSRLAAEESSKLDLDALVLFLTSLGVAGGRAWQPRT